MLELFTYFFPPLNHIFYVIRKLYPYTHLIFQVPFFPYYFHLIKLII